jgi:hypothetical protein
MTEPKAGEPGSGWPIIPDGDLRRADGRINFDYVKRLYQAVTPELLLHERWIDPHFARWESIMTPIEMQMWSLIRSQRVPFYPQYPVGGYFLDFGNPRLKIGIECDSRGWHAARADLDEIRLKDLYDLGWLVFGFSGRACTRLPELPPILDMAAQWRAAGHGKPLPATAFYKLPRATRQQPWVDDYDVDSAQQSTFEWFGSSLAWYMWEEEQRESGFED